CSWFPWSQRSHPRRTCDGTRTEWPSTGTAASVRQTDRGQTFQGGQEILGGRQTTRVAGVIGYSCGPCPGRGGLEVVILAAFRARAIGTQREPDGEEVWRTSPARAGTNWGDTPSAARVRIPKVLRAFLAGGLEGRGAAPSSTVKPAVGD